MRFNSVGTSVMLAAPTAFNGWLLASMVAAVPS